MTTTQLVQDSNGSTIGRVTLLSINTKGISAYRASRRTGEDGVDIRRVSQGFRSVEAATAWIRRSA